MEFIKNLYTRNYWEVNHTVIVQVFTKGKHEIKTSNIV